MSDSVTADTPDVSELIADLEAAAEAYERASDRVADRDEAALQQVADTYEELESLFDRYEDQVKGDGDFATFIQFQEAMARFTEGLAAALPHRDRFEEVDDVMQQRRLTQSDFDRAREILSPIADDVALLTERDGTRRRYQDLRDKAQRRIRELGDRISDLESLQRLGAADLDAPVERLREPIESYNDAVTEAFSEFRHESSARDVLAFVETTTAFPLVPFREPPRKLREYVETHPAGTESIVQLQEYADYSTSKLDHYVEDAGALKQRVATHQTYLRRLDADPLRLAWPPRPADELRWRLRELIQVTGRFAPADVVALLRDLRDWLDDPEYDRLRESALARDQLTADQRERLETGAVADELAATREAKTRLEDTLSELSS